MPGVIGDVQRRTKLQLRRDVAGETRRRNLA